MIQWDQTGAWLFRGQDQQWEKVQSEARLWVRAEIRVRAWLDLGCARGRASTWVPRGPPHFLDRERDLMVSWLLLEWRVWGVGTEW